MEVEIEKTGEFSRRFRCVIPAALIKQKIASRLKKLANSSRLDGFRPGKVPMKIIRDRYQEKVLNEVAAEEMERGCRQTIDEQQWDVVHHRVASVDFALDHDLCFTVWLELFPQFDPLTLDGEEVEEYRVTIQADDIDKVMERVRRNLADSRLVDRPAQKGDRVQASFVHREDARAFLADRDNRITWLLGSEGMSEDVTDRLQGVRAGDAVIVQLTLPRAALQKKEKKSCRVQVKSVEEVLLPLMNGDFYKRIGAADGSEKAARALLREGMEHELKSLNKSRMQHTLMLRLLKKNVFFETPKALLDQESERIRFDLQQGLGMDDKAAQASLDENKIRERAERNVRWLLIGKRLIEKNQLTVTQEQVEQAIDRMAAQHEDPPAAKERFLRDQRTLSNIYETVMQDQVFDLASKGMKKIPVDYTFTEFIRAVQNPVSI